MVPLTLLEKPERSFSFSEDFQGYQIYGSCLSYFIYLLLGVIGGGWGGLSVQSSPIANCLFLSGLAAFKSPAAALTSKQWTRTASIVEARTTPLVHAAAMPTSSPCGGWQWLGTCTHNRTKTRVRRSSHGEETCYFGRRATDAWLQGDRPVGGSRLKIAVPRSSLLQTATFLYVTPRL